jgi:hypothetical protein
MTMLSKTLTLALAAAALAAGPAAADVKAKAPAPAVSRPAAAARAAGTPYVVKGFRSALFGMDEAAVRAAAAKDFAASPGDLKRQVSLADGTVGLILQVAKLEPGPGAATVQYILGAKSGTLVHVNVVWEAPATAPETDRQQLIGASLQLTRYFRGFGWAPRKALAELPAGPNSLIAFAGEDATGGVVEMRLDGVAFSQVLNGQTVQSPPPKGPARLRLAFDKNPHDPDVAKIAAGAF